MDKVLNYIKKHRMVMPGDQIIVGVSGGADSVCLLFLLFRYREKLGISLEVVHIEHGIRGKESREDALFVEKLCKKLGIPFFLYEENVPEKARQWKCSLEEAGRRVRYQAFEHQAGKRENIRIAVAHNRDDLAETVLFHIARGCSMKGLSGIPPVRGRIIRPLLELERKEIERILDEAGMDYRIDRTNLEEDYTRNRIRLSILPSLEREVNGEVRQHLASLAGKADKVQTYLEKQARKSAELILTVREKRICLEKQKLLEEEELIREYIFLYALDQLPGGRRDFTEKHLYALEELLWKQSGRKISLPGDIVAKNQGKFLILEKACRVEKKEEKDTEILKVPGETEFGGFLFTAKLETCKNELIAENVYTKCFDYDTIKDTISLRRRQPGDYLTLGKERFHQALKKYFINEKIPADERDSIPLLADGNHIIWVVGRRISESFKITEDTRNMLKITAKPLGSLKSTETEESENGR